MILSRSSKVPGLAEWRSESHGSNFSPVKLSIPGAKAKEWLRNVRVFQQVNAAGKKGRRKKAGRPHLEISLDRKPHSCLAWPFSPASKRPPSQGSPDPLPKAMEHSGRDRSTGAQRLPTFREESKVTFPVQRVSQVPPDSSPGNNEAAKSRQSQPDQTASRP